MKKHRSIILRIIILTIGTCFLFLTEDIKEGNSVIDATLILTILFFAVGSAYNIYLKSIKN